MDHARRGADAIGTGDFPAAISHYTQAIKQMPQAVDYYIKRSTAYTRSTPPDHQKALEDSENAVLLATKRAKRELIASAQLRRAIALFGLEKYGDSTACLEWVKKWNEHEKSLAIWEMKINGKIKNLPKGDEKLQSTVQELPENKSSAVGGENVGNGSGATESQKTPSETSNTPAPNLVQTPAHKIRHDWTQRPDEVEVTLFAKGIPKDKAVVDIGRSSLSISFPLATGSDYDFSLDPLFAAIDPQNSSCGISGFKATFKLKKARPGEKWASLEGTGPVDAQPSPEAKGDGMRAAMLSSVADNKGPAYPTSSKSGPKNWDKVAADLTKKPQKVDAEGAEGNEEYDGEEGDPVNNFFKTLYSGADDDTRRAMMKSYQESNGTALSTNWSEVSKGKVETTPPDGMEAKTW